MKRDVGALSWVCERVTISLSKVHERFAFSVENGICKAKSLDLGTSVILSGCLILGDNY